MTLTKAKKPTREPAPAGTHVARLYQIIHIGTVPTSYKGQDKMTDKIRLTFELSNEKKVFKEGEEARPLAISREFTYSWGSKGHLRPFVEGLGGVKLSDEDAYNFDMEALLGQPCLLNVIHEEKEGATYANVNSASPLPKGMVAPELFNETQVIDINSTPWDEIATLPEFIINKMMSSEEWNARKIHEANLAGHTSDIDEIFDESPVDEEEEPATKPKASGFPPPPPSLRR